MARKRLSYEATANLAILGGTISLGALVATWWMSRAGVDLPVVSQVLGIAGVVLWFPGTAAGILATRTRYKRRALAGLALCLAAAVGLIASSYATT